MKRRNFIKSVGAISLIASVVPQVLSSPLKIPKKHSEKIQVDGFVRDSFKVRLSERFNQMDRLIDPENPSATFLVTSHPDENNVHDLRLTTSQAVTWNLDDKIILYKVASSFIKNNKSFFYKNEFEEVYMAEVLGFIK